MEMWDKIIAPTLPEPRTETAGKRRSFLSVFATIALVLGSASPLAGLMIIIIHSLIPNDRILNVIGSFLMIVSIPLLLLGSHLLDMLEKS